MIVILLSISNLRFSLFVIAASLCDSLRLVSISQIERNVTGNEKGSRKCWIFLIGAVDAVLLAAVAALFLNTQNSSISELTENMQLPSGKAEQQKYIIEDCSCDYETVNRLNTEVLHPLLQDLVNTPFYRYFKVKLWCDCPFWPDDGMCRLRDCSV